MICLFGITSFAQKPLLDTSVYGKWPTIGNAVISNDGKYVLYWINNKPAKSQTLIITAVNKNWQLEISDVPKGFPSFTGDGREAIVKLKNDSLGIFDLGTNKREYIKHVKSFMNESGKSCAWIAYLLDTSTRECIIRNTKTNKYYYENNVIDYVFNENCNSILLETGLQKENGISLVWMSLIDGKRLTIWSGEDCSNFVFDRTGNDLAFLASEHIGATQNSSIWRYQVGNSKAELLISDSSNRMENNFAINVDGDISFSKDAARVFFSIHKVEITSKPQHTYGKVNIWNYKDKYLQSTELAGYSPEYSTKEYDFDLITHQLVMLGDVDEKILFFRQKENSKYILVHKIAYPDGYYNPKDRPALYLESVVTGARTLIKKQFNFYGFRYMEPILSPDEKYVVFFDLESRAYFSYEIQTGILRNISSSIPTAMYDTATGSPERCQAFGIGGWMPEDRFVFLYDQFDIWEVDLQGIRHPIDITQGIGRQHHMVFAIANPDVYDFNEMVPTKKGVLLVGYNRENKENGFWQMDLHSNALPEKLCMDSFAYYVQRIGITAYYGYASAGPPVKASDANVYLVRRMRCDESLNLFVTTDFKHFRAVSSNYPEKSYNWIKDELVKWKLPDGRISQGIIYKPENFDSTKKYPVIFNYYEKRSDELNKFIAPKLSGDEMDIPSYVSNGYLVFVPDIYYAPGKNGKGVVDAVVSAANYLRSYSWVDYQRMGLQGHSFGGWETNYLATHTHIFAAACEASGPSDQVSMFGEVLRGSGETSQVVYELDGQGCPYGIGITPWSAPQQYMENSPVFYVDSVSTPFLMMQGRLDDYTPYQQAMEMFTAMKRAGKKVWLLDYDNGGHGLFGTDAMDYTIRMRQFFDYYLKGSLPPVWMTKGVPASKKGEESGLDLDHSGTQP